MKELSDSKYLPDLLTMLQEEYFHPLEGKPRMATALEGLQFQRKMTPEQQAIIANELKKIPSQISGMKEGEIGFAETSMSVLSKYPSPEHEQLVLRFIDTDRNAILGAVVFALHDIGTSTSLPALERLATESRNKKLTLVPVSDIEAAMQAIKQREAEKGKSSAASDNPVDTRIFSVPQQPSKVKSPSNAANASQETTDYTWLPWLFAVLASLGGVFWLMKKPATS